MIVTAVRCIISRQSAVGFMRNSNGSVCICVEIALRQLWCSMVGLNIDSSCLSAFMLLYIVFLTDDELLDTTGGVFRRE